MSAARGIFQANLRNIQEALKLETVAVGAKSAHEPGGILILRRGILVTSLIIFEAFVRDRTAELLVRLGGWPAGFEDLPQKLRDASLLDGLTHLQRYAMMVKRNQGDYEKDLKDEIRKMAGFVGPSLSFTRFVSGDQTGNISESSVKSLLSIFQIKNCWQDFRQFSSDIGFGVPSVEEILNDVVRKRHRSAHAADYAPTIADISDLAANLFCLGICFDVSMTASIEYALVNWKEWSSKECDWRGQLDLYTLDQQKNGFRLARPGKTRAIKVFGNQSEHKKHLAKHGAGRTVVVVTRDESTRPRVWEVV